MFDVYKRFFLVILFQSLIFQVKGDLHTQNQISVEEEIQTALSKHGFENVAVLQDKTDIIITYENRIYRYEARAVAEVLKCVTDFHTPHVRCILIPQKRGIPIVAVTADLQSRRPTSDDKSVSFGTPDEMDVIMTVEPYWAKLKDRSKMNPSIAKLDITVHPQFRAQFGNYVNTVESQINLAPAFSTTLWKGMSLSAQWIFPLQNEMGYEGDFTRPGLLTLNQTVRLPYNTFLSGTAGYFTQHRYGADLEVKKFWRNGRWAVGINMGYTGFAAYLKKVWYWSQMVTWTSFFYGEYRFPKLDFTIKATYGKFVYRDQGLRFEANRQFGEVTIGFFTIKTTRGRNGGFSFSVPIFPSKRLHPARIRISPASQFPWSYWYSGLDDYGIQYMTGNSVDEFIRDYNSDFLRNLFNGHSLDTRGGT